MAKLDKSLSTTRGTTAYRSGITLLLGLLVVGMARALWVMLPANVDAAVAATPTVIAHAAAIAQAQAAVVEFKADVVDAKNEAKEAASKADASAETQTRIFAALKQSHDDTANVLQAVAVTNQSLNDVKDRLTRIENKQDQAAR